LRRTFIPTRVEKAAEVPPASWESEIHFINVDLDIVSTRDLTPLVAALGTKVIVLYCEKFKRKYYATLEIANFRLSLDGRIRAFCKLIEGLSAADRALWDQAKTRTFNIGIQGSDRPRSKYFVVQGTTVRAVAAVNAQIALTVYAPDVSL
jgi:hypothetical protein